MKITKTCLLGLVLAVALPGFGDHEVIQTTDTGKARIRLAADSTPAPQKEIPFVGKEEGYMRTGALVCDRG